MRPKAATRHEASTLRNALVGDDEQDSVMSWVRCFLEEVATGERAPAAKLHPLGFHCFPVYRSEDFGLCVHGWVPGAQRETSPTSDMHMHTFDMISRVLTGAVSNKRLNLVGEGAQRYRIYEIHKGGREDVDVFTDTGIETAVEESLFTKVSAGEQYEIPRDAYHSADETVQNQEFTLTLMLAENWHDGPQRTLVESTRAGGIPLRYERKILLDAEIRSSAREILDML